MKVHLGCGKRYLGGYVHVDLADYPHIDYMHDIKTLPMFGDDSADLLYASHVIEYFDRFELMAVLKEWRRVLRGGGILRLAVPDFKALTEVYLRHGDMNLVLGPLYGRWPVPGAGVTVYHKTAFDYGSLKAVLESAGFRNVRGWDWREVFRGELAGFDDYSQAYIPHMDKEGGRLISLNLEAEK
jgi:predicted SAM-dependent methyltransferase